MRLFLLAILVLLATMQPVATQAGSVSIVVSDEQKHSCLPHTETDEETQYLLTSEKTITALDNYFKGTRNPELYDAAIVNARIVFCSKKEENEVLSVIIQRFDQPEASKNLLEVATNYYHTKMMQQLIQERLDSDASSPQLKANLNRFRKFAEKAWSKK